MDVYGRSTVSEFLSDRIVYRNLAPYDTRLPGLEAICLATGIPAGLIPRKHELEYARVIAYLLQQARQLDQPLARIRRLAFIGDTRMSDGTAFENLCQVAGWPGRAFIGTEDNQPEVLSTVQTSGGQSIYLANRWSALYAFDQLCAEQDFPVDDATALVLDLDKTTIGARGRNAKTIDGARVQAVKDTVAGLLGKDFDEVTFQAAYSRLDTAEFHPFTTDNQDYLAYVCLILGSGLYALENLVNDFHAGRLASFQQFICQVDERKKALPPGLVEIHNQIYGRVQAGDPTPFKAFRRNEYRVTVGRMGCLDDETPLEDLLKGEIVITQEVRALALNWAKRGALVFGLSDKPDEASIPTHELAKQGFQPIHATPTHVVGA